jgi:hypothetical protein
MPTLTELSFLAIGAILGAWWRGKRIIKHDAEIQTGIHTLVRSLADAKDQTVL